MDKKEEYRKLWLQIKETEKKIERAKLKRNVTTILCFAVVYFVIFYIQRDPEGWDILGEALTAIIVSGIHFLANAIIFSQLVHIGDSETKHLEALEKQLSELSGKQ